MAATLTVCLSQMSPEPALNKQSDVYMGTTPEPLRLEDTGQTLTGILIYFCSLIMVVAVKPSLMAQYQIYSLHLGLTPFFWKRAIKLYLFIKGTFLVPVKEYGGKE